MYYQSLTAECIERDRVKTERAEKKRVADEYYFKQLCSWFHCSFEYPGEGYFEKAEEVKEQMHKDEYSYAEIGIMAKEAYREARADYWADLRERRQALKNEKLS